MDTNLIILLASIGSAILVIVGLPVIVMYIRKNKVDVEEIFKSTKDLTEVVSNIAKLLNLESESQATLDKIVNAAEIAVKYAEQLYKSGQLPRDERKAEAVKFVKMALVDAGIDLTEERKMLIDYVIEAAVYLLPKTEEVEEG